MAQHFVARRIAAAVRRRPARADENVLSAALAHRRSSRRRSRAMNCDRRACSGALITRAAAASVRSPDICGNYEMIRS